jgi:hypothetical protein
MIRGKPAMQIEIERHGGGRIAVACLVASWLGAAPAQPPALAGDPVETAATSEQADTLARREAELARQYLELERSFLRLADILTTTDPRRAAVLRDAFDQARDADVGDRLGEIVRFLEAGQLLQAGTSQAGAIEQFRRLLDLLEEGGQDRNLSDTKRELRQFLGRVTKLIARQRDIEGSTEAGAAEDRTAARQREAAEEAGQLAKGMERLIKRQADAEQQGGEQQGGEQQGGEQQGGEQQGGEQQGGEQQGGEQQGGESDESSGDDQDAGDDESSRERRTRRRLEAAEARMRQAAERLDEARRKEARAEQERAIEELESARAELEEILRQMREEEAERLLVQLETRIRAMLKAERSVRDAALGLVGSTAMSQRERQLEAARLGREQEAVTAEATRALLLVQDDGSAVAIPQALGQVRDDSAEVATRLARGEVTPATLEITGEIVTGLEELLAALEKSRREEPKQEQAGQGGGRPAEPGERPLVDKLAELKMLRSLQVRVNARTERFSRLLDAGAERAVEAELLAALGRLAERQRAIEQAARDIVTGRTER